MHPARKKPEELRDGFIPRSFYKLKMSCDSQYHFGYSASMNFSHTFNGNRAISKCCFAPCRTCTGAITTETVHCVAENQNLCGRVFAPCLAFTDVFVSLIVLIVDIASSLTSLFSHTLGLCCFDSEEREAFRDSFGTHVGTLVFNIFLGPILALFSWSVAFKTYKMEACFLGCFWLPCFFPVHYIVSLFNLCWKPEEAAKKIEVSISQV